jgi:hypothetical protein
MPSVSLLPWQRSAMWQSIAGSYGGRLKQMPEQLRKRHYGPLSDRWDTELEFAAYKRILDREEPDYAT